MTLSTHLSRTHSVRSATPENFGIASLRTVPTASPVGLGSNSVAHILGEQCYYRATPSVIVVEYLDAQIGTWQCSTDEGETWSTLRTDLINRPGCTGLELERTTRLRVLPQRDSARNGTARLVFHAAQRTLGLGNGSYRTYPPDDRGEGADSVTLFLTLGDINGMPPEVFTPRARNKRALAAQRHSI
ncbi:MAG: hypothetical protein K2Q97_06200 [Burkholderiaceae bacterium]|nr:hypothetical protein [Burkholderiaceae bacterium]